MGSGFEVSDGEIVLRLNTKVYPIERIYATLYIFLDKFYFILDGDRETEVVVYAKPKKSTEDLEQFSRAFFEELLSITNYFNQFEKNKEIIGMVVQRALFSVVPDSSDGLLEKSASHQSK
jgi:His-Xaa-Ser system protein HxsD